MLDSFFCSLCFVLVFFTFLQQGFLSFMGYLRTQFQEEQLEFKAKERPAAQSAGTKHTVSKKFANS